MSIFSRTAINTTEHKEIDKMTEDATAPTTPLEQVMLDKKADIDRRQGHSEEAESLLNERDEVTKPLPLLNDRLIQTKTKLNQLTAQKGQLESALNTAQVLRESGGIDTSTEDEEKALADVTERMVPLERDIATLQARIDEINAKAADLIQQVQEHRAAAQVIDRDVLVRERAVYVEETRQALVHYLHLLGLCASFNGIFPRNLIDGTPERLRGMGVPDQKADLPAHLEGIQPIDAQRDGLMEGLPQYGAFRLVPGQYGVDVDAIAHKLGVKLEKR